MKQNLIKRVPVNRKMFNKQKFKIVLSTVVLITTMTTCSAPAFALPSYGFGAVNNDSNAVHIDMNKNNISNRDAIHIDIATINFAQQNTPRNGEHIGVLTIPSGKQIGVFAGESMQSMDNGSAHFSDTGLNFGNTVLIGHNRGRSNGFFIFVKDLQVGQRLTLEANGITKTYVVAEMYKIHATDTELLMQFQDSRLSLLTCWEDEKDYRHAVIAFEEY